MVYYVSTRVASNRSKKKKKGKQKEEKKRAPQARDTDDDAAAAAADDAESWELSAKSCDQEDFIKWNFAIQEPHSTFIAAMLWEYSVRPAGPGRPSSAIRIRKALSLPCPAPAPAAVPLPSTLRCYRCISK